MLRQKPLVVSLILAGLFASVQVGALGLDRLNVSTAIGQPLVAEVDLTIAAGDDVDSIRANIASPAVYRAAGVEYQGILQAIRVQVLRRPNGRPYLRLASSQSINDPYLDILVEVNSSTGRLVREYVFLLDPPATAVTQTIEPSQPLRPPMSAQSAPSVAANPTPRAPPLVSQAAVLTQRPPAVATTANNEGGNYNVKSGDTLSRIAGRNTQPGVSIEQLMIAIQRSNPDAFIGGNINRLRAGASLNIPAGSDAQSIAQTSAVSEVRAQAASWRGYVARVADSVPYVAVDQPSARASGRVSGAVADTGGGAANADKLKLSQGERSKQSSTESKVAATKALKEEQSRAAQLERTRQDLEKALLLKNQAMADAQAKAREAVKPPPSPAPAPVAAAKVEPPKPVAAPPAPAGAPALVPPPAPATVAVAPTAPSAPSAPSVAAAPPPAPVAPPAPAPVAVAAPPPAAPVVVKTPPTSAPASGAVPSEPDLVDMLGDNPMPAAAAGLGVLGLLGAFLWSRRRKNVNLDAGNAKLSEPMVNTVNPDTVFGTSGLGVVKTNDVPVQSQFSRSGMGTIDAGEVDPVAEAEVYIAYGREAQAEEILREALQRDPQRPDVATKLAEISANQGKRDSFDQLVANISSMDRTGEYKSKLAAIAATHFPDHPLVGAPATASAAAPTMPPIGSVANVPVMPIAASIGAVAVAGYAAHDARASAPATAAPAPGAGSLDFVLDGMTFTPPQGVSAPAAALIAPVAAPTVATSVIASAAPPNHRKSLEDDLAELEASLRKATTAGQLPESGMDFTDFSTATPTNLGTVGPSMRPEMLDLSFDAGRQGFVDPTPSILDGQWHDASTKLDLARAYEEMGDREGAREILREVIHDGDEVQIKEAKAMLAKLGG